MSALAPAPPPAVSFIEIPGGQYGQLAVSDSSAATVLRQQQWQAVAYDIRAASGDAANLVPALTHHNRDVTGLGLRFNQLVYSFWDMRHAVGELVVRASAILGLASPASQKKEASRAARVENWRSIDQILGALDVQVTVNASGQYGSPVGDIAHPLHFNYATAGQPSSHPIPDRRPHQRIDLLSGQVVMRLRHDYPEVAGRAISHLTGLDLAQARTLLHRQPESLPALQGIVSAALGRLSVQELRHATIRDLAQRMAFTLCMNLAYSRGDYRRR